VTRTASTNSTTITTAVTIADYCCCCRYDSELTELTERVDALQRARSISDGLARDQTLALEAARQHAAAEIREYSRELTRYRDQLEAARDAARSSEGRAAKAVLDAGVLQRKVRTSVLVLCCKLAYTHASNHACEQACSSRTRWCTCVYSDVSVMYCYAHTHMFSYACK
jgi:hypothetical protein